jgi:glycosyltransferase involved in cell wall biosynthesis
MPLPHISVCVCTYRRPELLLRLLTELARQETDNAFAFSVIVTDNDDQKSAEKLVSEFSETSSLKVVYTSEGRRSISHARNKGLEFATGEFVAFIDDDEFPPPRWLATMLDAHSRHQPAALLGPVRPHFDSEPPPWLIKGRFCERPEHETGFLMPWQECRTGNVLLELRAISGIGPVFRSEFGSGGSDTDLFRRLTEAGHKVIWCNEAPVYEVVPPNRWKRTWMIKRALLRGRISLLHPKGRWQGIIKSCVAVPAYAIALPFLQLAGHHWFMLYLVKLCDHAGKLLALVGLNPVRERVM